MYKCTFGFALWPEIYVWEGRHGRRVNIWVVASAIINIGIVSPWKNIYYSWSWSENNASLPPTYIFEITLNRDACIWHGTCYIRDLISLDRLFSVNGCNRHSAVLHYNVCLVSFQHWCIELCFMWNFLSCKFFLAQISYSWANALYFHSVHFLWFTRSKGAATHICCIPSLNTEIMLFFVLPPPCFFTRGLDPGFVLEIYIHLLY